MRVVKPYLVESQYKCPICGRPEPVGHSNICYSEFMRLRRGKYILTKVKKSKKHIKIGNKDILVS